MVLFDILVKVDSVMCVVRLKKDFFLSLPQNKKYYDFAKEWLDRDYSPLFEWCSPRNLIVLKYEDDSLVLTAIRNNIDGTYVNYDEMIKSAEKVGIPCTEVEVGTIHNLPEFMEQLKKKEGIEGVVIRFNDGRMYKLKTDWYFSKSKKEKQEFSLNSERMIWKLILEQTIDDALSLVNDHLLKTKIEEFQIELYDAIQNKATYLDNLISQYRPLERKKYVESIRSDLNIDKSLHHLLFPLHTADKQAVVDVLINYILKNTRSPQTLEAVREILGGIKFKETILIEENFDD